MPLKFAAIKQIVAPTVEPVTVAEAKAQLRILHSDEDVYITGLIKVAREWAEDYTRRAFVVQTFDAQYPSWPSLWDRFYANTDSTFQLPRPPLLAVTSVKYYDANDALQTLDPSNYNIDLQQEPGTVKLKQPFFSSYSGPTLSKNFVNPVTIRFTAGYSPTADDTTLIPNRVKQAILIMVAHFYQQRTPVVIDVRIVQVAVPYTASDLLDPIRLRMV